MIRPDIGVLRGRQRLRTPLFVFLLPYFGQPAHRCRREIAGVFAVDCLQCRIKVVCTDAFEVEHRYNAFNARRFAQKPGKHSAHKSLVVGINRDRFSLALFVALFCVFIHVLGHFFLESLLQQPLRRRLSCLSDYVYGLFYTCEKAFSGV